MRDAEQVTFGGGGGLDRAAALRGDGARVAALRADPATAVLPFWRGKPLVAGTGRDRLGLIGPGHPVLAQAAPDWLFLGLGGVGLMLLGWLLSRSGARVVRRDVRLEQPI